MRALSLLLVCGLRLHRWSDRAVAGAAVAGMRPARRRCSTASPGPCPRSSRWILPLLVTRPLATPLALRPLGTLRPLEDVPALLTRAGFSGPDALHIYRALLGFLHGHILNSGNSSTTPRRPTTCFRLGLHRLPIGEIPLLRGLASVLADYDGPAELKRGLDILLAGLTTTLTPQVK
jgi:Tetracyclin repressor-like, C-terminal domain